MRFVVILMMFAIGCEAQVQVERPAKKTVEVKPSPAPRDIEMPKADGDYAIVKLRGTLKSVIDRDGISFQVERVFMNGDANNKNVRWPDTSRIPLRVSAELLNKAVHLRDKRVVVWGTYQPFWPYLPVDDLEEAK